MEHKYEEPYTRQAVEAAMTQAEVETGLSALSAEELLLLNRNADQFRHYINKKAKRLKLEAAKREATKQAE